MAATATHRIAWTVPHEIRALGSYMRNDVWYVLVPTEAELASYYDDGRDAARAAIAACGGYILDCHFSSDAVRTARVIAIRERISSFADEHGHIYAV